MLFVSSLGRLRSFVRQSQGREISAEFDSTGIQEHVENKVWDMPYGVYEFRAVTWGGTPREARNHFSVGNSRLDLLTGANRIAELYGSGILTVTVTPYSEKRRHQLGRKDYLRLIMGVNC